jgi:hypothetical protein
MSFNLLEAGARRFVAGSNSGGSIVKLVERADWRGNSAQLMIVALALR